MSDVIVLDLCFLMGGIIVVVVVGFVSQTGKVLPSNKLLKSFLKDLSVS